MTAQPARTNGDIPHSSTEKTTPSSSIPPRVVLAGKTGRILCVADIRGDYHELNRLIREHEATAVIHTGDFGFMNADSVPRMGDKILRHLITYSPLIPLGTRNQLLSEELGLDRQSLIEQLNNSSVHFPLSQFPHLLSGAINFPVPVFTVWGLIEDVRVLEKFRTGEYEVNNLFIIDEATSRVVDVGGVKLRLFGLGGAVTPHKMCEGFATIAGGSGTMWSSALQMGELIDTAQRVYDASETRLFISSAPIRNGLISLIANALKADLTISGGLHFRYPVSFNEYSIHEHYEQYTQKLLTASRHFTEVYDAVRDKVDSSMSEQQQALLRKITAAVTRMPIESDQTWTNTWNWILSDASCGHMVLSIADCRVSAETKTAGLNFAHRSGQGPSLPSAPIPVSTAAPVARRPDAPEAPKTIAPTRAPIGPGGATASKAGQISGGPPTGPNSFKNGINRTNSARPIPPSTTTASPAPVAPANATSSANGSIPVKTPTQPRGRGGNIAGQALAVAGAAKDKIVEAVKPGSTTSTSKPPASAPAKPPTPGTSAKPTATSDKTSKDETKKTAPATNGASTNGASSEAGNTSTESKEGAKPAHSREGSGEVRTKKANSLYLKGLPEATTEEEIKGLFKDQADKIAVVKIISDRMTNKQKGFGYVDFSNEEDMNAALKVAEGAKIRDKVIQVEVSNPPTRSFPDSGFRGRGGRGGPSGFRGGRGGRGFGSISGGLGRKDGVAGESKEGGTTAAAAAAVSAGEKKE
ncbi:hypothetical protein I204_06618 [Kwoniella mangroviensis CBS 8886]|uniref:uncharacterized protein n=1 Tax=Kwoniella mangroviensis CBS 8507 TaxID=1296122 RepID=UPI00080CC2EE|nr:uncharacterized protein I203_01410 [Kwoniella mangroviensis CBS 8507]OCF69547.1 hypothetical protein I203_01410 [Kwoniella mangroviensis CBS 8507]OCF72245.1 hypothetical protein I204_06618 [Kwoniella mangroviensis CBS 8886]